MGSRHTFNKSYLGSAAKENLPPKMEKQKVSVEGLFKQQHDIRKKQAKDDQNVFAPKGGRISKTSTSNHSIFSKQGQSKKSKKHPVYLRFAEVANEYREAAAEAKGQELEPVYQALVARVDGLDIQGQPLDIPGRTTKAEIDALAKDELALAKPLDEEQMTIQTRRKNGSVETKEVKLGDTMRGFEELAEQKRAELEGLLQKLKDVDDEIAAAQQDVVDTEEGEVKKANEAFNAKLDTLKTRAENYKNQTLADVQKARKEEESAKAERSRKMREFMESLC